MAITDTINLMKTNITNAYSAIEAKGGAIPTNKNLENMAAAISSITAGAGSAIEEVSTQAALKEKCIAANAGKVYRYTGTTSGNYINGALYRVNYISQESTGQYTLGLDICKQMTPYTITWNLTYCYCDGDNLTTMGLCGEISLKIIAYADYTLPESITVSGCSYEYTRTNNNYSATLRLYNPTGNITVTIAAAPSALDYNLAQLIPFTSSYNIGEYFKYYVEAPTDYINAMMTIAEYNIKGFEDNEKDIKKAWKIYFQYLPGGRDSDPTTSDYELAAKAVATTMNSIFEKYFGGTYDAIKAPKEAMVAHDFVSKDVDINGYWNDKYQAREARKET